MLPLAEAQLDLSRAALESKRRLVSAQRSNAEIASEQIRRAQTNLETIDAYRGASEAPDRKRLRPEAAARPGGGWRQNAQVLSPKPKSRRLLLTIWSMMSPLRSGRKGRGGGAH